MPNTPLGYPYPAGSDRLMDGDNAIQALAQVINDRTGIAAAGSVSITPPSAGNPGNVAVTFPVGRFTATPSILVSPQSNGPSVVFAGALSGTATGFNAYGGRTNSSSALTVMWVAIQL